MQMQLHTRGWDIRNTCTAHTHTLRVEQSNHISCLPAIHHSHRRKHMQDMWGNYTATCRISPQYTQPVTSSQHTLKSEESVQEKKNCSLITCNHHARLCTLLSVRIRCTFRRAAGLLCCCQSVRNSTNIRQQNKYQQFYGNTMRGKGKSHPGCFKYLKRKELSRGRATSFFSVCINLLSH